MTRQEIARMVEGTLKSPIFIEWYSHEGRECYKLKNPFTKYGVDIIVLCPVVDGIDKAKTLALEILEVCLYEVMNLPVSEL